MTKVAIIHHSGFGHTAKQASAVRAGVEAAPEVSSSFITIDAEGNLPESMWEELLTADAIIFGSPTYMGSVSWQFKKFADASSKPWFGQAWKDKIAAGFTNSASMNGDKHSTLHYMITLAMQHGMLWVGNGMMPSSSKAATRNDINFLGSFAGAMAQSPLDSTPEEGPLPGDLETAKRFGERIAHIAVRCRIKTKSTPLLTV
jgi:NAD(P)H dehydrogenase (quinone)